VSRSGYSDDCENIWLYRQAVENSINGKRGQAFLAELLEALDALPARRLISFELVDAVGEVCALGAVGVARGVSDLGRYDNEDPRTTGRLFGIAMSMAAEIQYENDEANRHPETPEERFTRMRRWVVSNIKASGW